MAKTRKSKNYSGILYFYVHLVTEIICFYLLRTKIDDIWLLWLIPFIYDFLAFVPQILFGAISDRFAKIPFGIIGVLLMMASIVAFQFFGELTVPIVCVLALGNAAVHVNGAEVTLRSGQGKMTPAASFVAGGSFGVITGTILSTCMPVWPLYTFAISMFPIILLAEKYRIETAHIKNPCKDFNFANLKMPLWELTIAVVFVVIVRGFIAYSIPTSWNKSITQAIVLFFTMGIGKALGGVLIDHIGIRKTIYISILGAIPFLLFGNEEMEVSLIGVMMFSMTMAITLAILVSRYQQNPGVAFGFTTVGLTLGTIPIFYFRITDLVVNDIIIVITSLICLFILLKTTRKEKNVKHIR